MKPQNAFEIFKLLEKSNCGNCGEKTCLAFAGAVFKGQRRLGECPRLDPSVLARYAEEGPSPGVPEPEGAAHFRKLKNEVAGLDLAAAAARVGGRYAEGRLTLKVLGKDFGVDARGNFYADIHVNPWVAIPFLTHIV